MRSRPAVRAVAAVTCALLFAAGVAACGGGDDDDVATATTDDTEPESTTTTTEVTAGVALALGDVAVASTGPETALDDATKAAILAATQKYVDTAVTTPLLTGAVGEGYDALFDATVAASATGADRAVLTDEGITPVNATPTVAATPVRIDALADGAGALVFLAASFNVDVSGVTDAGPLTINRLNELTLAPGPNGTWPVTAYRVSVTRTTPDAATTTTTAEAGA